jgi:hypothetical protein
MLYARERERERESEREKERVREKEMPSDDILSRDVSTYPYASLIVRMCVHACWGVYKKKIGRVR